MLDVETKRRIDSARDILVGKVPDPKSQVEQITIALIYKFMDDMDVEAEELGGERTFFRGAYAKYAWRKIFDPRIGGFELLNLYGEAITKMDTNPDVPLLFRNIFKNAYLPYRDPETLKIFLKVINEFEYSHSEKLGDAFEYLLSVLGSQGDAGQFRTPRHIIDFMVEIMNPQKHESILDPACGTAGFLISSFKHVIKQNSSNYSPDEAPLTLSKQKVSVNELVINNTRYNGDKLTADDRIRLAGNIFGYDISPDMVRLSLVNMYLHGIKEPHISEYDTLTSEENWNHYADVILANPPFMSPKGGIRPHKRFSVPSNRSEVLFVDYIAEHLSPNGRAAVIVPEGIIFQSGNAYKQLRKMLVENYLVGVISLPAGVFQPYSGVKTSILWMDRSLAKKTDKILFVKIENDGFDLGAQRRPINGEDLSRTLKVINDYKEFIKISNNDLIFNTNSILQIIVVGKKTIGLNGEYNLSIDRYKSTIENKAEFNKVQLENYIDFISGLTLSIPACQDDNGLPIISMNSILENGQLVKDGIRKIKIPEKTKVNYLTKGDLLFNWRNGSKHLVGKTAYFDWDGSYTFASFLLGIRTKADSLNSKYLWNILNYCRAAGKYLDFMRQNVNGLFNREELKLFQIPLPPLSVQQEIVDEIEGYQKIIDGARMVVDNYKPRIEIDPEWEMVELGEVTDITMGQSPPGESYNLDGIGIPLINGPVEFGSDAFSHTIKRQFTTQPTKFCEVGDLILCVRGSTTGRMNIAGFKGCIGRGVAAIRAYKNQQWINHVINLYRQKIYNLGSGSTFPNITAENLKVLKIPMPPYETQCQIVTQIEQEITLVNANMKIIEVFEQKIKDRIARVWGE